MNQEKEKAAEETAVEKLAAMMEGIEEQKSVREFNILNSALIIKEDIGLFSTRRLYMEMCLKFTRDPENAVTDDEIVEMLGIFEVLNVM
jgi:hypothetical protein